MVSRRQQWLAAVRAAVFPVGMRPVKATLLSLPIEPDGTLTIWRDDLSARIGLPCRTIDRHLARACGAQWLHHEVRGGHGRRATYTVRVPGEVVRHKWPTTCASCAPHSRDNSLRVVRHVVANSIEDRASVSEHVAVNNLRERRADHDGTRADPDRDETRADKRDMPRVRLVDLSPWARLAYAGLAVVGVAS